MRAENNMLRARIDSYVLNCSDDLPESFSADSGVPSASDTTEPDESQDISTIHGEDAPIIRTETPNRSSSTLLLQTELERERSLHAISKKVHHFSLCVCMC